MRSIWLLAATVLLCGCQSGADPPVGSRPPGRLGGHQGSLGSSHGFRERAAGPEAAPTPRNPLAADTSTIRPVIACFGDSLTAGYGVPAGESYPDVLQKELDRAGYRFHVANFGVSGETTEGGLARTPQVIAARPAIVVLEFGANDGFRGIPVDAAARNLRRMIEDLQKGGANVVLAGMTLPSPLGWNYLRRFEGMYADLASRYRLVLIPFLLEGVAGHPQFMQPDGVHPNAEGAARIATTVFRALQPILAQAR